MMFHECRSKGLPQWWAGMVLVAPITFPFLYSKSRKEINPAILIGFFGIFAIVAGSEFYLYKRFMEKNKFTHLPPVTRQMLQLSETLRQSTINLDGALIKLENLSKVESRIHEIKNTIQFIGELRLIMAENRKAIHRLVEFTTAHNDFFAKKDLAWVFDIQRFYNNHNVVQHYKSLEKYLQDFEELLRYTHLNFYNITEVQSPEHLKNYDEYYIRYRRAVDSHNRFNVKRIDFQNQYLRQYPDIKAYLPGERQTETFRLWE